MWLSTRVATLTHPANGVEWYYTASKSWGFAPGGAAVNKQSCDTIGGMNFNPGGPFGDKRICWHTNSGGMTPGWRCGVTDDLTNDTYERVIYQAP